MALPLSSCNVTGHLLAIGALSWSTIGSTLRLRAALARDEASRQAQVTLDRLRREIRLAFLTRIQQPSTPIKPFSLEKTVTRIGSMSHKRKVYGAREAIRRRSRLGEKWTLRTNVLMHREMGRSTTARQDGAIQAMVPNVETLTSDISTPPNEWVEEWD